ncbi:GNAT family N-acetyltransferase [Frondihabitans cladoniiphilus]|uniref:GNAT family N-acetyltransferase n=1 Tax=Frondihabitans cladoniiphilus TaxID=715785 RepID=A0ABP8VZ34_9MICO
MGEATIRWAAVDDARGVAVVHVETWRAAYAGLIDDAVLAGLDVDRRTAGWTRWITHSLAGEETDGPGVPPQKLVVADVDGRVVGWAGFGPGRDEGTAGRGELGGLYVHPAFWSQKIGHALVDRVEAELTAAGFASAYLWVLDGNERAIRFYERHGWAADGGEKVGAGGGATGLHELRHTRVLG